MISGRLRSLKHMYRVAGDQFTNSWHISDSCSKESGQHLLFAFQKRNRFLCAHKQNFLPNLRRPYSFEGAGCFIKVVTSKTTRAVPTSTEENPIQNGDYVIIAVKNVPHPRLAMAVSAMKPLARGVLMNPVPCTVYNLWQDQTASSFWHRFF